MRALISGRAKRVLVTGDVGFVRSHLCDRPISDGCDVLAVDNSPQTEGHS
jgi:nucleoside-diphosphate-sugar epimerase